MDIFNHALAGAATGLYFGYPIEGAMIAILPDLVLGIERKYEPSIIYNFTHSLLFVFFISMLSYPFYEWLGLFSCLSHLLLDIPTHGKRWAPVLFWPHAKRFNLGNREWEFFNVVWIKGFLLTLLWIIIWLYMM